VPQVSHVVARVAPTAEDEVPAEHGVHMGDPEEVEYEPAAQSTHVEASVAPCVAEEVPAAHFVHDSDPGAVE
jgi:hypothetical protein